MNVGQKLAIKAVEHELRWTPKSLRFERARLMRMVRLLKHLYE